MPVSILNMPKKSIMVQETRYRFNREISRRSSPNAAIALSSATMTVSVFHWRPHCLRGAHADTDDIAINVALVPCLPACAVIKRVDPGSIAVRRCHRERIEVVRRRGRLLGVRTARLRSTDVASADHPQNRIAGPGPNSLEDTDPEELTELPANFAEQVDAALAPLGCTWRLISGETSS